jgi:ribonuclease T1
MQKMKLWGLVLGGILLLHSPTGVMAKEATPPAVESQSSNIALHQLPPQGIETYRLIHQGGPFPFEKDGVVFGNRERQLPTQKRGYYHEYTVKTPHSRDRGARRIVCGGALTTPDACYYTEDHYTTFRKIVK